MFVAIKVTACLVLLLVCFPLCADELEHVRRGKAATALVEGDRTRPGGTAFCISRSGYFVCDPAVIKRSVKDARINLLLNPGEKDQVSIGARVVREDRAGRLAILKALDKRDYPWMELGTTDGLTETETLIAITSSSEGRSQKPQSLRVKLVRITSLHKVSGQLQFIEVDQPLGPSGAGGPLLDSKGKVVAVIQSRQESNLAGGAIPISVAIGLVGRPTLTLDERPVPLAKAHEDQKFEIQVEQILAPPEGQTIELTLGEQRAPGGERKYEAKPLGDGKYTVTAPLIISKPDTPTPKVWLTFPSGGINGKVADTNIDVDGKPMQLSSIDHIGSGMVRLRNGTNIEGKVKGLESLSIDLGEGSIVVDASKAMSLRVELPRHPEHVRYGIRLKASGEELAATTGTIPIVEPRVESPTATLTPAANTAPAPSAVEPSSPAVQPVADAPRSRTTLKLPGLVDDVIVGGGGRYLLLHFKSLQQLAVFDIRAAKIVKFLSVETSDILVGAGMDKIVIVLPDLHVIQRWNLTTFERELTVAMSQEGTIDGIALGSASAGPFMLMLRTGPTFWDLTSLKQIAITLDESPHWRPHPQTRLMVRASADGKTFAARAEGSSPTGLALLTLDGTRGRIKYEHESAGDILPSSDGSLLFTLNGLYSANLQPVAPERFRGLQCLPALQPGFFLGIANQLRFGIERTEATNAANVFTVDNQQLLFVLTDLDELAVNNRALVIEKSLPMSRRIFFAPDAKLLVTIPKSSDQLILRRVDTKAELERSSVDYLFVDSLPKRIAQKGSLYEYPVNVESKRGGVKYKLESGPEGMSVSDKGVLSWQVPAESSTNQTSVVLAISDPSGQEVFHSFVIQVK